MNTGGINTRDVHTVTANPNTNAITYSCTTPLSNMFDPSAPHDTTNDPQFADFTGGDYRLRRASPCVNSGTNESEWMAGATDLDGRSRLDRFSSRVDMGAYEFVPGGILFSGQ